MTAQENPSPSTDRKQASPRHRESGPDRRLAIAAAARQLIVEKGLDGLRTRDIASAVGINIATLHYHVPTKEALIELVTASMRDEFAAQSQAWNRENLTPADELRLEISEFQTLRQKNPQLLQVMAELGQRARIDENVARYLVPLRLDWRARVAGIIRDGKACGQFRSDLNPEAAAVIVTGTIIGLTQYPDTEPPDLVSVSDEILRSFLSPTAKEKLNAGEN